MKACLVVLSSALLCIARGQEACDRPKYQLSKCMANQNNQRQAFLFYDEMQKCDGQDPSILKPITGIPCEKECGRGEYLSVNTSTRDYQCSKCPRNSYSNGGGFSIDGHFGEWKSALEPQSAVLQQSSLTSECFRFFWIAWLSQGCEKCGSSENGKSLVCGVASARDTQVAFEVDLKLFFVKDGKIEFRYRKDTVKENGNWLSGIFSLYANNMQLLFDSKLDDTSEWKYFSMEVSPGMKELTFLYQKFNSEHNKDMKFEINDLRVTGTQYSELECTKCNQGYSQEGSDRCSLCAKDYYMDPDSDECQKCPEGTYSAAGSFAKKPEEVCFDKRDCTLEEIPKIYDHTCKLENNRLLKAYTLNQSSESNKTCYQNSSSTFSETGTVPCEYCEAGKYYMRLNDDKYHCHDCPKGSYLDMSVADASLDLKQLECQTCPAGYYLEEGLQLTKFEVFPSQFNFSTECRVQGTIQVDQSCHYSNGFLALYDEGLIAGKREQANSVVTLTANLDFIRPQGSAFYHPYIEFEFKLGHFDQSLNDQFSVYVNGKLSTMEQDSGQHSLKIMLSEGKNKLQWHFNKGSEQSEVTIFKIKIVGSSESNGGAIACHPCPEGFLSTEEGSNTCQPCPTGFSQSKDKQKCEVCPEGFYTPNVGSRCLKCPANSVPSSDKSKCVPMDHLIGQLQESRKTLLYHFNLFSTNVSDSHSTNMRDFKFQICSYTPAYCNEGFFGPAFSNLTQLGEIQYQNQFYISPMEVSNFSDLSDQELELSQNEKESYTPNSFIMGLFDEALVSQHTQRVSKAKNQTLKCSAPGSLLGQNQRVVKSLGTKVEDITVSEEMFTVKYGSGDSCFYSQDQRTFSSEVRYICDKGEEKGWPVQQQGEASMFGDSDPCHIVFEWRSMYACRQCLSYEVTSVSSPCLWNIKEVEQNPGKYCQIFPQSFFPNQSDTQFISQFATEYGYTKNCNPLEEVISNKIIGVIITIIGLMLCIMGISIIFIVCQYRRLSHDYFERVSLINNRDPGRNSMSDRGNSDQSRENQAQEKQPRQVIYKIGDDDD